jgi:hypothetical protein
MTLSDDHLRFLRRAAESAVSAEMDVAVSPNILFALLDEIGLHRATSNLAEPGANVFCTGTQNGCEARIEGHACGERVYAGHRYCPKHQQRFIRTGDPTKARKRGPKPKQRPLPDRN